MTYIKTSVNTQIFTCNPIRIIIKAFINMNTLIKSKIKSIYSLFKSCNLSTIWNQYYSKSTTKNPSKVFTIISQYDEASLPIAPVISNVSNNSSFSNISSIFSESFDTDQDSTDELNLQISSSGKDNDIANKVVEDFLKTLESSTISIAKPLSSTTTYEYLQYSTISRFFAMNDSLARKTIAENSIYEDYVIPRFISMAESNLVSKNEQPIFDEYWLVSFMRNIESPHDFKQIASKSLVYDDYSIPRFISLAESKPNSEHDSCHAATLLLMQYDPVHPMLMYQSNKLNGFFDYEQSMVEGPEYKQYWFLSFMKLVERTFEINPESNSSIHEDYSIPRFISLAESKPNSEHDSCHAATLLLMQYDPVHPMLMYQSNKLNGFFDYEQSMVEGPEYKQYWFLSFMKLVERTFEINPESNSSIHEDYSIPRFISLAESKPNSEHDSCHAATLLLMQYDPVHPMLMYQSNKLNGFFDYEQSMVEGPEYKQYWFLSFMKLVEHTFEINPESNSSIYEDYSIPRFISLAESKPKSEYNSYEAAKLWLFCHDPVQRMLMYQDDILDDFIEPYDKSDARELPVFENYWFITFMSLVESDLKEYESSYECGMIAEYTSMTNSPISVETNFEPLINDMQKLIASIVSTTDKTWKYDYLPAFLALAESKTTKANQIEFQNLDDYILPQFFRLIKTQTKSLLAKSIYDTSWIADFMRLNDRTLAEHDKKVAEAISKDYIWLRIYQILSSKDSESFPSSTQKIQLFELSLYPKKIK